MDINNSQKNLSEDINYHEDKKRFILKGRFKSNSHKFYGLFLIVFNIHGEMDIYYILVSTYSSIFDIEPHSSWEKYEEYIIKLKWNNEYNPNMTYSLQDVLNNIERDNNLKSQLYNYVTNYDYDNVDILIGERINRIIHDKNIILETGIQEITEREFLKSKQGNLKPSDIPSDKIQEESSLEDGAVILPIQLILAPVTGTPIFELNVGDKIMTKIVPNTDRASYFIDLLDLRVENYIKPVACEVIDIKSEGRNAPLEVLTKISPGIYGKCIEDERQVKLRMYNADLDGPITTANIRVNDSNQRLINLKENKKPDYLRASYLLVGLFVLVIIILLLLLYI